MKGFVIAIIVVIIVVIIIINILKDYFSSVHFILPEDERESQSHSE